MRSTLPLPVVVLLLAPIATAGLSGCGDQASEQSAEQAAWLDEYSTEGPFEITPPLGKEDGAGRLGPEQGWDAGQARVWDVTHAWDDVTAEAGLAWSADSGLDWHGKYAAWVASLKPIPYADDPDDRTFEMTTPYGKTLPAPVLECAEVAIFMRATFASWYGLPFYLEAWDKGKPLYIGHFGFLRHDGSNFGRSPDFARRYTDHSGAWSAGQQWPSDSRLRGRGLYGGGDEMPFLTGSGTKPARAGAYFDEIYLNKRVGHFMLLALSWFGSMHLADGANMFHVKPETIRPGDVLLERWQRRGIGHTIPLMRVEPIEDGRMEVAVATGSMPRRQPVWEEGAEAGRYFKLDYTGGEGETGDGDRYAALGGGIRRWRVATLAGSRYRNTFGKGDEAAWIDSADLDAVAARPARFGELLRELSVEEKRDLALSGIASARDHLRSYPASCAARTRREEAFDELVAIQGEHFATDADQTDREHRILDDYVFAELTYDASRTCCWNSTTSAMYDLVMEFNQAHVYDAETATCSEPVVFMARDVGPDSDGYAQFREFAAEQGRAADWVDWSEDEPCPWAATRTSDEEAPHPWLPWCDLK